MDTLKNVVPEELISNLNSSDAALVICTSIVASVAVFAVQKGYGVAIKVGDMLDIKLLPRKGAV